MEELKEAQQQQLLKNFIYRQNFYTKYQKENRDKCVMSSKKYINNLIKDSEKKAEYKKKKQEYHQRVKNERYKDGWKIKRNLR